MTDLPTIVPPSRRGFLAGLGIAAVGLSFAPLAGCGKGGDGGAKARTLNFYNWDTYIGETTLADFKAASGVDVNMSLFATNDELFAKLRGGNQGYDVIVPTNDFVQRMIAANMLEPLDHAKIPNFRNVDPEFQDAVFDPGRKYSMPYTWLVMGIGYRKSKVDGVPDSWKWMFDSDRYKGRISLVSEAGDLVRLAMKYLGKPMNTSDDATLKQVEALLIKQKPNVAVYHEDNGQDLLLAGDVDLVIEFNGDIAQVMREDKDIDFVVPREGSQISSDCLAIPKGAPNPDLAHEFINYLLDAKAGAEIARTIQYPTPNAAAKALMDEAYRDNKVIFPPDLKNSEYAEYTSEELSRKYEEIVTRVRAA
ncbi:ABC transporter substrate-binding protein [Edaphosphingomonas haloaromaticamans]|uniref:Putrescine-binding periplasmic protein n=1 Tax=Edaphosphingomonas haloaromaticamans TaxID=653954 RepID=A0A1S1HCA2_9SPHN|nr:MULTISPECIES: spermidine/putrescine ABC transporter substrate-binding protein [Sphingomonas]MDX3885792.1 spermidine/putrescine ABC transporter substrate-binding protein [Sphingomonas sp.]OHT18110.1 Spermidine/putrescine-binding periplasmic protein precursor [Sphingomonas haloaromaticamans]